MRYLTFALAKGRLAKQTLELFEKVGITCEEMKDPSSRKLIFVNEDLKLKFPNNMHEMMTAYYGDYMQLPPVEKRYNHCPYRLEFGDE